MHLRLPPNLRTRMAIAAMDEHMSFGQYVDQAQTYWFAMQEENLAREESRAKRQQGKVTHSDYKPPSRSATSYSTGGTTTTVRPAVATTINTPRPTAEDRDREKNACFHCHRTGHIARECPAKPIGNHSLDIDENSSSDKEEEMSGNDAL